jgi:hypothetical protein
MKKISRRNMMQITGLTAVGSLIGLPAYLNSSKKPIQRVNT